MSGDLLPEWQQQARLSTLSNIGQNYQRMIMIDMYKLQCTYIA